MDVDDVDRDDRSCVRRSSWRPEEDAKLVQLVQHYGPCNWTLIAQSLGSNPQRSGKSCRLRWCNQLNPKIKKEPFTVEEERTIISKHEELGNKWAAIAKFLPGRTDNAVKNYWNGHLKKKLAAEGLLVGYHSESGDSQGCKETSSTMDGDEPEAHGTEVNSLKVALPVIPPPLQTFRSRPVQPPSWRPEAKHHYPEAKRHYPEVNHQFSEVKHQLPEAKQHYSEVKQQFTEPFHQQRPVAHVPPAVDLASVLQDGASFYRPLPRHPAQSSAVLPLLPPQPQPTPLMQVMQLAMQNFIQQYLNPEQAAILYQSLAAQLRGGQSAAPAVPGEGGAQDESEASIDSISSWGLRPDGKPKLVQTTLGRMLWERENAHLRT